MQDRYYVQCCWTGRTEANEQIAILAADWFRELSRIDPLLERWYLLGRTPRHLVDGTLMGTIFGVWNGRDEPDHCSTNINAAWMTGG